MRKHLGETRSTFAARHAVISEDSHERVTLPNWNGAELVHIVTPHLGADFSMFFAHALDELHTAQPVPGVERFVLVQAGDAVISSDQGKHALAAEDYAFIPAGVEHNISATPGCKLVVIERVYHGASGAKHASDMIVSSIGSVVAKPMKGDERLVCKKLLPEDPAFDLEVNVMEFEPGASLPYVETHFMEHGLLMLDGGGIYRLEEAWYPVNQGDAIWMGAYCPQWFGAIGRSNARYLIYKNWNRDPLDTA